MQAPPLHSIEFFSAEKKRTGGKRVDRLEAEALYIAGDMSLDALADQIGMPRSTVGYWSKAFDWRKKRRKAKAKANKKMANAAEKYAVKKHVKEFRQLLDALPELEAAAASAAAAIRQAMEESPLEVADGKFRTKNLLNLAETFERLANARMTVSEIIPPADEEKLRLLRRKQELEEKKAEQETAMGGAEIVVKLSPEIEELLHEDDRDPDAPAEPAAEAPAQEP